MKNFTQVNRALAAEKNFYLNLNQLPSKNDGGQNCDGNRQSRVMSQSGCSAVDVPMTSYGASDEHPISIRSASDGRRWNSRGWKYVAMIFAVLVMSIANIGTAWGDAADWTIAASNFTQSPTGTFTYEFSEVKIKNTVGSNAIYVEVPSASASGTVGWKGSGDQSSRMLYIYGTNGTVKDEKRGIAMGNKVYNNVSFSSSDIYTSGGKYYLVFKLASSSTDWKALGVKYVLAASSGKNIYLKPNGIWNTADPAARFAAYYFKSSGSGVGWVDFASYNACTPCFKATIPSGYDKVILCRMDGSKAANIWDNKWNQTLDLTVPTGNDTLYTISSINGCTDGKSCGSWGTYTAPTYTISFNGNGSTSGSTSSHTGIACNGSQTLRANGFTRTGWTFTGWNTSPYGDGTAYAAGATISSITSDITLYAQWEKVMYMKSSMSWWYDASAWFAVWVANADESKQAWVAMTKAENCSDPEVYKATVPGNGYTKVVFVRKNPANMTLATWDNKWNQSSKESMPTSNNQFTITGGSDDNCTGSWGTYSAPTLTISYNNGGGSGSMSSQTGIACGTDKATTANAFTRDGYRFTGWKANVDVKVGGSTRTAGTLLADGVTIQDISSNITLTAQWESIPTYTVTYSLNGGKYNGSSTAPTQAAVASGTEITLPSLTPTKEGYVFASWKCSVGNTYHWESYSYTMTAANTTFTAQWVAAASLVSGTLYYTADIVPLSLNAAISATNQYAKGISSNGVFTSLGNPLRTSNSDGTMEINKKDKQTVDGYNFYDHMWFKGGPEKSGVVPSSRAVKFTIPSAGTLSIYCTRGDRILLSNGTTASTLTDNTSGNIIRRDVDVTAGTYYLYANNSGTSLAGLKFVEESCSATQPGTIGKGTLSACTLRLTAGGSPAANNTWYWQSTSDGEDKTESGATKDVTSTGTYYIRSYCTTGSGCWSDAQTVTVSASDLTPAAPTALAAASPTAKGVTLTVTDAANTYNYDFYVSTSSTAPSSGTSASYTSTSKSVTITDKYAGTTFYAWARAKCGSNKSAWTALGDGGTFTTSTVSAAYHLTNVSKTSGAESGIGGSTFTAVFSANTDYSMPTPVVTIGGNAATSGTDYTWTEGTGTLTIAKEKITGNIDITLNSADAAPSSAVISGTYHYFPGENISLTVTPSGNNGPTTYQWYKGGKADGNAIDGATSATFTKNICAFEDAGSYYCKVTCNATSIWANTNSSENYDVKILRLYVNGSRNGDAYGNVDFVKVDETTATASIALGAGWTYGFSVADGCGTPRGNTGTMTEDNCTGWTMNSTSGQCAITTTNAATYIFTVNYSNLSAPVVSVTYPVGNQAEGKVIYFDNNVLKWTGSSIYYRIGHSSHSQASQLSLVSGTANLYKMTTTEYNGFSGWHIANATGDVGNDKSIYKTVDGTPITEATAHEGGAVTQEAITVTPTTSKGYGADEGVNDNCEFFNYTITSGMKTQNVAISPYSNGTITVNYTNTSGSAATLTSGNADLAHSVILTSITAVADEGYDASAITINGGAYSANYVVTGNTTIAASFTLKTYTISYNKGTNGTGSKASETKTHGVNFTLPGSTFTYGGHAQDGWSTSDGGALAYALSGSYTTNAAQEFFPHWKCNTPEISCSSNTITITVPTGATVYYTTTTDGSTPADPTSSSTAYNPSSKPTISADTKIKAIAIQSGCTNSAIASASLTYEATGTRYYLFTPTSAPNPVHTGTLKGDFITDKSVGDGTAQTIDGNEFSKKSITIAGSTLSGSISGKKAGNYSIDYDVKTTSTTFYVYVSGANTSIYMHKIRESGYTTDSIVSQSTGASTGVKLTFTLKSKENTRVCFSTGSTSVRCYQIVAVESGDALPQACDEGYELNFNSGRYAYLAGSSNQMTGSIDGLDICSNNSYQYKKSTALELTKNSSDTYISFTTGASACAVKVTFSDGTLILNTSKSTSGGVGLTSNTAANLSASTTYYIINTNTTNRASITKIAFEETAAATYTLTNTVSPSGYGTVSPASVSSIPSGTSTSSSSNTYTVNGTTVTATPAATTAEYTYAFDSWSDLPATVAADAIVTANFTRSANSYTLAWSSNGGSDLSGSYTSGSTAYGASITAPSDPTLSNYTFDGWKTNDDGTGSAAEATMPAANTTYYAAWKQTVTLKTGAQGSGADQTPYVYINGTGVSDFTPHTATGYTLQGYYTVGSGGVKVLNADGTFAAANVTDYITSGKWSRTGAAPTLFAQWVATEDCRTLKYVWKVTGNFCDDKSTATSAVSMISENDYFTLSGTGYQQESGKSLNLQKTQNNYFLLTAKTGYEIKSICFYGKVEDSSVDYTTDGSSWSSLSITNTSGDDYYSFSSINASHFGIKLTAATPAGVWIRNMVIEVCAEGGTIYNVEYDGNDETGGTAPTDATDYSYGAPVTVLGNTGDLAKTNYTFAGWTTNNDGTGSNYVADNTFSITANTTLYAKWTQTVTLDKNGGSTDGSATAVWNATGLTGITHAKPAAGYKLLGYYSASSDGTKVLNSDGTFAATNVPGYITSGKWSRTSATTLYAEYESAGALTWNLIVNSDTANLSTSTKTSAFTEISTTNMTNATLAGDLTYEKSKKSALTGKISTPASYDADDYVYVTFQVASGYKFTPSSVKVKAQPVTTGKDVKLSLTDGAFHSLVSSSATSISGGSTQTVTLAGNGTYFTGTVTLKIYCYGATDKYRLGTPITIEGEIEEACGTMPSYTSMSYTTTTFAPGADASGSPITIVGGENIDTYQWKYNKVNDRTSGTNCGTGTSLTPLTDEDAATDGTRYYWCEMTNTSCGITIKSPAVAITVAAAKSDATVAWTNPESTPNYGGGGYTIKATVDQTGWDGNAADLVITAPAGIRIYNVSSGTDVSSRKYVQADFDVQTSFDRSTYASNIPFSVSAAATASYNAISDDHNVSYSACSGGGGGSSYNIRVRKSYDKDASNNYRWVTPGAGEITYAVGSSISSGKAGTAMATDFDSIMSSDKQYIWVKTFVGNIKQMRLYVETSGANISVSALYQRTTYAAADAKDVITGYSVVYDEDDDAENTGTKGQHTIDLIFTSALSANDIICVKFSSSKVKALGAVITEGSAGSLNTYLQWSGGLENGATVNKNTTDAYFTYSASKITENTNTLGAITYSSSNASVATVDATGKVALVAVGSTTIKATLAASGCYKKAEISYTLNVTEVACAITAGTLTLTSGTESKCSSANVTLTLTGFESGASIQWKDGDTDINNGGNYTIETDGTTSTLTTDQEGTYSVMVTSGCSVRSNRITISNKSTEVGAKRIVKNWYIKNGRLTPDIELWTLQNGAHLSSVAWDPVNATGLTASDFYESDGKVYLKGKEPSSNASGADIDYTLTLTVEDDCGSTTEMSASGQLIYLHHQKNTDKHVLAFVVTGTEKGEFTEGITAAQTTSVELYNTIAANFDVLATNVYSTDDEQALKEYYSQFDILCVTDYPNTGTKGVNKKSYVDALGALVDIRPILTMEAFVAKLANWKAKGISGTPQSPTTRQYTMLLQCKDHEIFSGTKLTKVGEGDETMYRVSMVDQTVEEYPTLDGYTPGSKDYNAGGKPALQGFTFTKEMLDDDLLPLGLIDDGSGNDLQVGIERQTEMEARLMVLGINSYAMERLTADGQTVVVNALKYLMKKNSEDIADCSNTFVGGDDEEDESTRSDWNVASHWSGNAVPDRTQKVRIVAPCVIKAGEKFHVTGVVIAPSGKYNHGANTASGSLTIAAGGALIVDGKVEAAKAPLYTETRATSVEDLTIQTSSTAQGALIFDNDKCETQATVELYSLGRKESGHYQFQYYAVPMDYVSVSESFAGSDIYTYVWHEATGWERRGYYTDLYAFEGVGITTKLAAPKTYTMKGALASTATKEITLTIDDDGYNLIGNSWTAPIQISQLEEDNSSLSNKTVYIYNAGNDTVGGGTEGNSPGQWTAIPFNAVGFSGWSGMKVIPAMQAFELVPTSEETLTLDYDKVVRGDNKSLTEPLHAPRRVADHAGIELMRISVADSKTHTDLHLFEGERFSDEFDNGWEAAYKDGDEGTTKLYADVALGRMAVVATDVLEGTLLGFAPGKETEYTFTFGGEGMGYYLNDLKLKTSTLISEEDSYSFTYEEGDTNRFYISRTRIDAPQTTTGVTNLDAAAPKAQKFIYQDKMYIMVNGRVYSAEGQMVK